MSVSLLSRSPFGKSDASVFSLGLVSDVEHSERIRAYHEFWRFYRGKHWAWRRDESEPVVTLNYARRVVDILTHTLFKAGVKITIPDDPMTPGEDTEDRQFVKVALEETWRRNKAPLCLFEIGQMGSVTGDVFVRASWEENDPLEEPYVRLDVIPSGFCFPMFDGPHGPDRKRMSSILLLFPKYVEDRSLFGRPRQALKWVGERWTANEVVYYEGDKEVSRRPNSLGEIPVVHIANYPISGEFYGVSDLEGITDINRELNEKATDVSDVVAYQGSPVTIVKGAKLSQLERGPNRMWGIPESAAVENLGLNAELQASLNYVDLMKTAIHDISGIPVELFGSKEVSVASGAALAMRYTSVLAIRDVKALSYGLGLRLLNRLILRIMELKNVEFGKQFRKLKGNRYRNEVVFPDPLPRDESLELDKAKRRIDLGLSTRRRELINSGMSPLEADTLIDEWYAERKREAEVEFEAGQRLVETTEDDLDLEGEEDDSNRSGNPDPVRPNPDVQGEKRSMAANK